jgi:hypothetical protein
MLPPSPSARSRRRTRPGGTAVPGPPPRRHPRGSRPTAHATLGVETDRSGDAPTGAESGSPTWPTVWWVAADVHGRWVRAGTTAVVPVSSGPGQQWSRSAVVPVSSGPGQQWSRSARTTAGPARVGPPPTSWHTCPSTTRPSTRSPGAGRPVSFATSGGRLPRPPSRPPDDARRTSVADGDLDGAGIAAVTDRSGSSMEAPATASSTWRCSRRQPGGAGAGGARSAASPAPRTDAFDRRPAEAEGVRIPPTRRRRRALAAPAGPAGRYRRRRSGPRRNRPRRPASAPRGRGRPAAGHRPRPRRPVTAAPVRPPTPPLWRPDGTGRPRTTLVEASLGIPIRTAAG